MAWDSKYPCQRVKGPSGSAPENGQVTFVGLARAIARRWWIPVAIAVVAVVSVLGLSHETKAGRLEYSAKAILIPSPSGSQAQVNLQEAALQVTVGDVPAAAAAVLHYTGNPAQLASEVTATVDSSVGTLDIEVTGTDGARAAAVANEFADELNQNLLRAQTTTYLGQVANVQKRLNDLQDQINQYEGKTDPVSQAKLGSAEDQYRLAYDQFQQLAAQGQPVAPFSVLQKAVPVATGGAHPPLSRADRSLIAGIVGLLIGIALTVVIDMLWPKINDRVEAEREFGSVVLAEVPKLTRRERQSSAKHRQSGRQMAPFREAYRMLRTSILLIGSSDSSPETGASNDMLVSGPQVILVSSPLPKEGKSTTVASLAVSMAETGRRVLICNADFRAPQVHKAFDLPAGPGLSDLLSGEGAAQHLADLVHPTGIAGVSLVHSGSKVEDAAELIARRGAQLLEEARAIADVVLVDTAPLLVVSDASELLPAVDAVVLVARVGQTSRDSARRSYELLDRAAIPVLGVVLVGAKSPMSYYYGGRYGASQGNGWRSWFPRRRRPRDVVSAATEPRRARSWAESELDHGISYANGNRRDVPDTVAREESAGAGTTREWRSPEL